MSRHADTPALHPMRPSLLDPLFAPVTSLEGVGPAVVEDIFALAVRFQVARGDAQQFAVAVFETQMMTLPAGLLNGAVGVFKRR